MLNEPPANKSIEMDERWESTFSKHQCGKLGAGVVLDQEKSSSS